MEETVAKCTCGRDAAGHPNIHIQYTIKDFLVLDAHLYFFKTDGESPTSHYQDMQVHLLEYLLVGERDGVFYMISPQPTHFGVRVKWMIGARNAVIDPLHIRAVQMSFAPVDEQAVGGIATLSCFSLPPFLVKFLPGAQFADWYCIASIQIDADGKQVGRMFKSVALPGNLGAGNSLGGVHTNTGLVRFSVEFMSHPDQSDILSAKPVEDGRDEYRVVCMMSMNLSRLTGRPRRRELPTRTPIQPSVTHHTVDGGVAAGKIAQPLALTVVSEYTKFSACQVEFKMRIEPQGDAVISTKRMRPDLTAAFHCPITMQMMEDPVILDDEYTYERIAIVDWLHNHNTSPLTRQVVNRTRLLTNRALRDTINAWKLANPSEVNMVLATQPSVDMVGCYAHAIGIGADNQLRSQWRNMFIQEAEFEEDKRHLQNIDADMHTINSTAGLECALCVTVMECLDQHADWGERVLWANKRGTDIEYVVRPNLLVYVSVANHSTEVIHIAPVYVDVNGDETDEVVFDLKYGEIHELPYALEKSSEELPEDWVFKNFNGDTLMRLTFKV